MLLTLNKFLKFCSENSPGYELKIEFSKIGSSQRLSGLLNESRMHDMVEDSDFNSIDNVSSFLGRLVDSHFGVTKNSETTSPFTEYADLVIFLFKCHKSFE